jgi:glycosyltransferase involved in cell wall biosynthesis
MRILHVIDSLEFGGAEKVLVALANGFASRHEVTVCCISRIGELASELDARIPVICMHRGNGNDYLLPWRLARKLRDGRYDVVHAHNWGVFLESGIAAWLARVPVAIHTVHGPYLPRGPGWRQRVKKVLRHAAERRVARSFGRIVAVSDAIRAYIPETTGIEPARLDTVHNGIAGGLVQRSVQARPLTFITVGRLDAIKNHAMMFRAFAQLARRWPECRLVVAGDGPQRQALESLIDELHLRPQVSMLGFRTDVADLLREADIFLMSSRYEGISIALLEAMRAGLPAVATRVGGMPEMVIDGQTGLLVPSEDTEAFAQAMARLAEAEEMRLRFGIAAQALQQREFSLETMLARYEALYTAPLPATDPLPCH